MVDWPWLIVAFIAGAMFWSRFLGLGLRQLRKDGMKVTMPEKRR